MSSFHSWLVTSCSGVGAQSEQLYKGVEEGLQPALVGHTLLNYLLLARVLGRLLNTVRLSDHRRELGLSIHRHYATTPEVYYYY